MDNLAEIKESRGIACLDSFASFISGLGFRCELSTFTPFYPQETRVYPQETQKLESEEKVEPLYVGV